MGENSLWKMAPLPVEDVSLDGGFWGRRAEVNRTVTLRAIYEQLRRTGRIDALKLARRRSKPLSTHPFWGSDVAKWLEAACHALGCRPDRGLRMRVNHLARLFIKAQQPDGYLNPYFSAVAPERRWTNLRDSHELYCAGHLMEAAIAHHRATGQRGLLDALCRYADHIGARFGRGSGKKRGYPGHEEIELALVKLWRATGKRRYLELASYFVEERGRRPHCFEREARARGEDPGDYWPGSYDYCQAHAPVREQTTAEGHAVRAMYLYCAMADLAGETADRSLLEACRRLWRNVVERRIYVTGGVGSTHEGERFTSDYDLPNETAYAETCAAVGLVLWAHRMLLLTGNGRYADVMERALYNGVLSGVSLRGDLFFYANPLAAFPDPGAAEVRSRTAGNLAPRRQEWFGCACCPPNLARLIASLPGYVYSRTARSLCVHLFTPGSARFEVGGRRITLGQQTRYPWEGHVQLTVRSERPVRFTLAVRVPGWSREWQVRLNGKEQDVTPRRGYARLQRTWQDGDQVELDMAMPAERLRAHPEVRADAGRVALRRGPLVYCLEEADNGPLLGSIALPADAPLRAHHEPDRLGGVTVITASAERTPAGAWPGGLYSAGAAAPDPAEITAVPYYAWANRTPGEMLVWIRET
jgi:hypothetical protein